MDYQLILPEMVSCLILASILDASKYIVCSDLIIFFCQELLLKEGEVARLVLECQDATRLMPDGCPEALARLSELKAVQEAINVESAEAGAKHRLYTLLEARTKSVSQVPSIVREDLP